MFRGITLRRCRELFVRHLHFVGPGLVSAVAYIDPGNWATDLSAGAEYGYKLLFIVLLAGFAAVVLQLLAVRLGTTTGQSLAAQTRLLFLRLEKQYPKYRVALRGMLYFLYGLAEIAIIGTDLAELIGSAIALNLLFPKLPLYAGVLVTAADVMVVLAFFRSNSGRQGMMFFEIVIVSLVLAVFVSFMILLNLIKPEWKEVFLGLVPSETLVKPGALYIGVGIIGATVMPHALFLGSSLASVDRLDMVPSPPTEKHRKSFHMPALTLTTLRQRLGHQRSRRGSDDDVQLDDVQVTSIPMASGSNIESEMGIGKTIEVKETDFEKDQKQYLADVKAFDRIAWVDVHLKHFAIDTAISLLGFALTINAAILTLAGAAYYYSDNGADPSAASLEDAYALIKSYIGGGAATIFALALLCAGQSASITATLAGQVVSEGFLEWRTSPFLRRLVTRLISVIPAAIVAAAVGSQGLNTMLVASQVLLSIVLPTVIFPLVYICSREETMTVLGPEVDVVVRAPSPVPMSRSVGSSSAAPANQEQAQDRSQSPVETSLPQNMDIGAQQQTTQRRKKSYKSSKYVTVIGYLLFGVVVLANGYVIVTLALGQE